MADLELPDDLLPLHVAALSADRAMTAARKAGGDVEAAREEYLAAAMTLQAHPFWEERRQAGQHQAFWQASLDAAKKALDGAQA
ncbi:hypothetical protein ACIRRH_15530 [Kitasatospora sp. NPDC101235]|uniref:hypothetical protein n=1 Tax=Kitasatospora sp. NPDC101235 TaxID=3364101 RepID=UPI00381384B2